MDGRSCGYPQRSLMDLFLSSVEAYVRLVPLKNNKQYLLVKLK